MTIEQIRKTFNGKLDHLTDEELLEFDSNWSMVCDSILTNSLLTNTTDGVNTEFNTLKP